MIQNNRKPFPFSRLQSSEPAAVRGRKELEEVVKWLQDEIDFLRDAVSALVDENAASNQTSLEQIVLDIQNLQLQIQQVADSIPDIDVTDFQPVNDTLTAISNLPDQDGDLHNNGTGVLSWVRHVIHQALARVAFTGRYKDLTGKPDVVTHSQLSKVAYTGSYKQLIKKPLLNGDTLYLFENTR